MIWCDWGAEGRENRGFFEQGDAEDLQDFGEAAVDGEFLFDDGNQHVHADCDPHLSLHRIVAGAIESFDSQMLLDPLEKQLDLPAALVELRDGQRWQREVVGQEHQPPLVLGVVEGNTTEQVGIQPRAIASNLALVLH